MVEWVQTIAVWALPVLLAVTLHEVAHGWAARYLGDTTAMMMGRLSLNPIKHVDPVGTILVPLVFLLMPGNFLFGWAKPVPVSYRNLRQPRRDMALVAAAGPLSNLLQALVWGVLLKVAIGQGAEEGFWMGVRLMATAGIVINLVLMALNLLPVPPLDGSRVVASLLPPTAAMQYSRIEPYGLFIIVGLMVTGLLQPLMDPLMALGESILRAVLGLA